VIIESKGENVVCNIVCVGVRNRKVKNDKGRRDSAGNNVVENKREDEDYNIDFLVSE